MQLRDKNIDIVSYLRVIIKHRWTILSIFAAIVVSMTIFTFTATPIYMGTVRLIIEKENPKVLSFQEVMAVDSSGSDYYQTQYKIIESRGVAREVIRRLQLDKNEEFVYGQKKGIIAGVIISIKEFIAYVGSFFNTEDPKTIKNKKESENDSALVSRFISGITVTPIRNSRLVDVSFEATNPALAAQVANTLAKSYIDKSLGTRLKATQDAIVFLNNEIERGKKKVDEAEQALLRYKEQHGIITDFSTDVENITAQKLATLNTQVVEAEMKRAEAQTRYQKAAEVEKNPEMVGSVSEVLNNDLIRQIKTMEVNNQKRMSELSNKYGKNHPQIIALQNEQDALQKRKMAEIKRIINSLKNEYAVAAAKEESLKAALGRQKGESLSLNEKAIQYSVLKREAQSTKEMYDLLFKRLKETSLTEDIRTGNIRIIDLAEIPGSPVKPKKTQNMMIALILGIGLSLGTAFFLERIDNTVKIPADIKQHLQIPYLGPVPDFGALPEAANGQTGDIKFREDLITVSNPKSTASEAYRGIRTNILFSSADVAPQVILISSSAPAEGKTITAANLAVVMAQMGNKVLLIDCDMRKPKLNKVFETSRDKGMSNILVGGCELTEAIISTKIPNLDIITSGPLPPNPSEIIGSQKMAAVVNELRGQYERIIIDSPPITAVTDASILAKYADGAIMVIRCGDTHMEIIKNGLNQLSSVNAHIFGAILNCVNTGSGSYYYYQYHYYYYGENGEKKKRTGRRKKSSIGYGDTDV
jgi:succinoglycan biosynthesis transport protein ExoP